MASFPAPSFFKPLLLPSDPHLPLPTDFVTKHLGNKIPEDAIIRTSNGSYLWKLKIAKIGDSYCFTDGWSNFVEEIEIGYGDILLFRLVDTCIFELLIYSPTGCQKLLPPEINVENVADSVSVYAVVDDSCNVDDDAIDYDDEDGDDYEEEDYENEKEDDEDEDDDDDDDVHIDGDDGDPFFISTISKADKRTLRLPTGFAGLAELDAETDIVVKNVDGQEWSMRLLNESKRYYLSSGWAEFRQSNELLNGDECVFKFITSESKLCLVKVTKNKKLVRKPRPIGDDDDDDDDDDEKVTKKNMSPIQGVGMDVKVETEDEDVTDDDEDDGEPVVKLTINNKRWHWRIPEQFMGLPGIEAGKIIMVKDLNGKEHPLRLLRDTRSTKTERLCVSAGWGPFMTSNKLLNGDKCVIKYITSEGKLCVTKVIKKNRLSIQDDVETEDENDTDYEDDDGDPVAKFTITKGRLWRIPEEFTGLPGIEAGKVITVKDLNGIEHSMCLLLDPLYKYTQRYHVTVGWGPLVQSNKLSVGDKCVIKYITNQGIFCLTKVIKNKRPSCEISVDQVVKKRKTRQTT